MKTDETNPDHWFELAAGRLRSADRLFAAEGASLAAVELLHEAAERYLKGFLIAHGWQLRRVHDLGMLLDEAVSIDPRFDVLSHAMERLTDQFWAQHYPGGDLGSVGSDFGDLRQAVGSLLDLFENVLGRRIARP